MSNSNEEGGPATFNKIPSCLKWHIDGGKGAFNGKLADWIISLMPPHTHYVEPYAGGLSVLLAKDPEGVSEVVNDIHGELTNFWHILQDVEYFTDMRRILDAVPFSKPEWIEAAEIKGKSNYQVNRAVGFFIRCRQSMSGRMDSFAPLSRSRTRRGMNEQASAWLTAIEGLSEVHARLKRVVIFNEDALKVIRREDSIHTLYYCDPPYVDETRAADDVYEYEYSTKQHLDLLQVLFSIQGKFLLSGYRCNLYDDFAATCNWNRHDFPIVNNAARGDTKRVMLESIWCNF